MNPTMQKMLEDLLSSGDIPPQVRNAVMAAMSDPSKLDAALEQLQAIGADQMGGDAPMDIADYYKPGPGKYELRWPYGSHLPLPMPFEDLDRKTQFFVLFQEWSRRQMEGNLLLNSGDLKGAEGIFQECLERAKQIDVRELEARSYEGFVRLAQKTGDRRAESFWLDKAAGVRQT